MSDATYPPYAELARGEYPRRRRAGVAPGNPDGTVSLLDDPARTIAACFRCDHLEESSIVPGDDWAADVLAAVTTAHGRLGKHLLEAHGRGAYWVRILNADDHVRIVDPAVWGREL